MQSLTLIGLNHRTAPVALRERFAFSSERQDALLQSLAERTADRVLLCTCNRTELIAIPTPDVPVADLHRCFVAAAGEDVATAADYLYTYTAADALRHIFRVASGLDSMVPGETQITGQTKAAFEHAFSAGYASRSLQPLYQSMLACARRVRAETRIGEGAVSVASVAVHLARSIFEQLAGKHVLLIGAGETCELAGQHFAAAGVRRITVANRTAARADSLIHRLRTQIPDPPDLHAADLPQLDSLLPHADIVFSSTDAPLPILSADQVRHAMRQRRGNPLFLIDIAVPRDIDPDVNRIPDVFLYNIDAIQRLVDDNLRQRRDESGAAEIIIDTAVREFIGAAAPEIGPLITSLRGRAADIKEAELEKLFRQHPDWTDDERQRIARSVDLVVNKLLHDPIISLRRGIEDQPQSHRSITQAFRDFFNL